MTNSYENKQSLLKKFWVGNRVKKKIHIKRNSIFKKFYIWKKQNIHTIQMSGVSAYFWDFKKHICWTKLLYFKSRINDNLANYQNICNRTFNYFLTTFFCSPIFKFITDKFHLLPLKEVRQIKNFFSKLELMPISPACTGGKGVFSSGSTNIWYQG